MKTVSSKTIPLTLVAFLKPILMSTLLALAGVLYSQPTKDSVDKKVRVRLILAGGQLRHGAYLSHTADSISILQPYSEVKKALKGKASVAHFQQYSLKEVEAIKVSKKSVLGGIIKGTLIIGAASALIGALTNSDDGYLLSGPETGALFGVIIGAPLGAVLGGSTKSGFIPIYSFRQKKHGEWSDEAFDRMTASLSGVTITKNRKLYGLVGGGYSSETLHLGIRYKPNVTHSFNLNGSFILAERRGFGIDYRRSFGKNSKGHKPFFGLLGISRSYLSSSKSTTYLSISIGKDFYFSQNTGISLDIGYDHPTSDVPDLGAFFGPRIQFFL